MTEKVTFQAETGNKFGKNRPRSVYNFYADRPKVWINPEKPDKIGDLPPIPVDNRVDSVDFCERHTLYIQIAIYNPGVRLLRNVSRAGAEGRPSPDRRRALSARGGAWRRWKNRPVLRPLRCRPAGRGDGFVPDGSDPQKRPQSVMVSSKIGTKWHKYDFDIDKVFNCIGNV